MTSFESWQQEAAFFGNFICMVCFEGFNLCDAYLDNRGNRWDLCVPCGKAEEEWAKRTP